MTNNYVDMSLKSPQLFFMVEWLLKYIFYTDFLKHMLKSVFFFPVFLLFFMWLVMHSIILSNFLLSLYFSVIFCRIFLADDSLIALFSLLDYANISQKWLNLVLFKRLAPGLQDLWRPVSNVRSFLAGGFLNTYHCPRHLGNTDLFHL